MKSTGNSVEERSASKKEKSIRAALNVLYPGSVPLEMRVITKSAVLGTVSGVYDDYDKLAKHALELNAKGYNIYITLNGTNLPVVNSWVPNAWHTTKDKDVPSYHYLLVDFDPVRAPNTSSTDEEKAEAWKTATAVLQYLSDRGWPEPFVADSGNGFHLLYRVELSVNAENIAMMRQCLTALDARFSSAACKIDTTTYNPARITKLYGTVAHKGVNIPGRPHRRSELRLEGKTEKGIVATELISALAAVTSSTHQGFPKTSDEPEGTADEKLAWLLGWLEAHCVHHSKPHKRDDGSWMIFVSCPWKTKHTIESGVTETAVFAMLGGFGFDCRHDHCADKQWTDYRRAIESGLTVPDGEAHGIAYDAE
jgi:hypothetical protein